MEEHRAEVSSSPLQSPLKNIYARDLFEISSILLLLNLHCYLQLGHLNDLLLSQDILHFYHHICNHLSYLFQPLRKLQDNNHSI